jgi:hypothetical protein
MPIDMANEGILSRGARNAIGSGLACTVLRRGNQGEEILLRIAPAAVFMFIASLGLPSSLRAKSNAATVFKANCTLYHGADGNGNIPTGKSLKAKDHTSDEVQKKSDVELGAGRDRKSVV